MKRDIMTEDEINQCYLFITNPKADDAGLRKVGEALAHECLRIRRLNGFLKAAFVEDGKKIPGEVEQ